MKCIHINIRKATFIIISFLINNINLIDMADNQMEKLGKFDKNNITNAVVNELFIRKPVDLILHCPSNIDCKDLPATCLDCKLNISCLYGKKTTKTCRVKSAVKCHGTREFSKTFLCRFCYQTEPWEYKCVLKANCNSISSPTIRYVTNCTVNDSVFCLGHRTFYKNIKCNWTGGYRWKTALLLSITLGGFGADRFYLGHWQEGIGKLFSFGGLGVWTIIDVVLISLHYLGPADGSLYI